MASEIPIHVHTEGRAMSTTIQDLLYGMDDHPSGAVTISMEIARQIIEKLDRLEYLEEALADRQKCDMCGVDLPSIVTCDECTVGDM